MNLLEVIASSCRILSEEVDEATKERVMRVAVRWQHAGVINGNRRRYPKEVLQHEINRLGPLIKQGKVSGASFHPETMGEVDDISHLWESISMEKDGTCTGVVKVIPTTRGKNVQTVLKAGGWIGMSSRGKGTTTRKEEVVDGKKIMVDEINPDFRLYSPGDFVLSPSVPDAGVLRMMESKLNESVTLAELEEMGLVNELTEQDIRERYRTACFAGYKGSLKEYRKIVTKE